MKWGDNETKIWRNFVENANESSEIRHFRLLQIGLPIYCNFILLTFNIIKIGLIKKEIMYTCICTVVYWIKVCHILYSHPAPRCPVFCENCFNLGILYSTFGLHHSWNYKTTLYLPNGPQTILSFCIFIYILTECWITYAVLSNNWLERNTASHYIMTWRKSFEQESKDFFA